MDSSSGTLFFSFSLFCHLPPLSSFEMKTTPSTSKVMRLTEKQPLFFFFFTIIYDLSDFINSLFTPTKTNKQDILIKRSLRMLVSSTPTHLQRQYDAAVAVSTFPFIKSTTFGGENCVKPDHRDHT